MTLNAVVVKKKSWSEFEGRRCILVELLVTSLWLHFEAGSRQVGIFANAVSTLAMDSK